MLISIFTGLAAGSIHVVTGADHLVSMAPLALRHPRIALRNGLMWGFGHSAGVLVLSSFAILLKDWVQLDRMSTLAEFGVGIALLVIGVLTIRTAFGLNIHTHNHRHDGGELHDHIHLHFRGKHKHSRHKHALTTLGLLHGFAGTSHLLAVIPALALPAFGAIGYMFAYLLGSILTMCACLVALSLASSHAGRKLFPTLFASTGVLSVLTGIFWLQKNFIHII